MKDFKVPKLSEIDKVDIMYTYFLFPTLFSRSDKSSTDKIIRWMIKLILTFHYKYSVYNESFYKGKLEKMYGTNKYVFNLLDQGAHNMYKDWNSLYFKTREDLTTKEMAVRTLNDSIPIVNHTLLKKKLLISNEAKDWYKLIVTKYDTTYERYFKTQESII